MPDWATHIGANFIVGRSFKLQYSKWFIIGGILPDVISRIVYVFLDLRMGPFHIKVDPDLAHLYFEMFHTPFMCLILALAIAVLFKKYYIVFISLFSGALLHFVLDGFQKTNGDGMLLLYPMYLKNYNYGFFWWSEHRVLFYVFGIVACVSMIGHLVYIRKYSREKTESRNQKFIPKKDSLNKSSIYIEENEITCQSKDIPFWRPEVSRQNIILNLKRVVICLLFVSIYLVFPLATMERVEKANINSVDFLKNQNKYQGKRIKLSVSEVVQVSPTIIKEADILVSIKVPTNLAKMGTGEWWSVSGVFKDGVLHVDEAVRQYFDHKIIVSLMGVLILLFYLLFYPPILKVTRNEQDN